MNPRSACRATLPAAPCRPVACPTLLRRHGAAPRATAPAGRGPSGRPVLRPPPAPLGPSGHRAAEPRGDSPAEQPLAAGRGTWEERARGGRPPGAGGEGEREAERRQRQRARDREEDGGRRPARSARSAVVWAGKESWAQVARRTAQLRRPPDGLRLQSPDASRLSRSVPWQKILGGAKGGFRGSPAVGGL